MLMGCKQIVLVGVYVVIDFGVLLVVGGVCIEGKRVLFGGSKRAKNSPKCLEHPLKSTL